MKSIILFTLSCLALSCGNNDTSFSEGSKQADSSEQSSSTEALALRAHVHQLLREERHVEDSLASVPGRRDTLNCGTFVTEEQYDEISTFFDNVCQPELVPDDTTTVLTYPVQFFVVTQKRTGPPVNSALIQSAFADLRSRYRNCRVNFELTGVDTLESDQLYNFNARDEFIVLRRRKENAISIFVFNSITVQQTLVNGYAKMGRGDDFIMVTGTALRNGITLPHEMGHYFLLYHTHGKTNRGTTDELVDKSNCSCSGDDVCDTPADPNLLNESLYNCVYRGTRTDAAGALYKPDPYNLMSYAETCRKSFTAGQYQRVRWAALKYRDYFRAAVVP